MTYIVGVKLRNSTVTICDTRVTFDGGKRTPENTWLKSGLFFHGCTFAYCDSVYAARKFIIHCKERITGFGTVESFWTKFCECVKTYDFPKGEDSFQLLLSSRASGAPTFYVLDSQTGILMRRDEDIITLGSGRDYLDGFVTTNFRQSAITGDAEIDAKIEPTAWMWCLQLMERVQGLEVGVLNEIGVGGYFHYGYQTPTDEFRQPPAVYILCDYIPEMKLITTWAFRICFCEAALVIECPINNTRFIVLDAAAWPRCEKMDDAELRDYEARINTLSEVLPYYNFCGFGAINPARRGLNPSVITNESRYLINRSGIQLPEYAQLAASVFATPDDATALAARLNSTPAPSL